MSSIGGIGAGASINLLNNTEVSSDITAIIKEGEISFSRFKRNTSLPPTEDIDKAVKFFKEIGSFEGYANEPKTDQEKLSMIKDSTVRFLDDAGLFTTYTDQLIELKRQVRYKSPLESSGIIHAIDYSIESLPSKYRNLNIEYSNAPIIIPPPRIG